MRDDGGQLKARFLEQYESNPLVVKCFLDLSLSSDTVGSLNNPFLPTRRVSRPFSSQMLPKLYNFSCVFYMSMSMFYTQIKSQLFCKLCADPFTSIISNIADCEFLKFTTKIAKLLLPFGIIF